MASISCKTCSQEIKFDASKLPTQVVSFSCPSCKAKVTYDNRPKDKRLTVSNITLRPMKKEQLAEIDILSDKKRGSGPSACILLQNGKIAPLITAGVEELGFNVDQTFSETEKMSDYIRKETPDLLFVVVPEIDGPPSTLIKELLMISNSQRRKIFVALMADNVNSNDGNAAFLFNVNCLLNKKDVDHFHHILYESLKEHSRLYHHYFKLREEKNLI